MLTSPMLKTISLLLTAFVLHSAPVFAQDVSGADDKPPTQLKVDDSEPVTDMKKTPPTSKSRSQLKRPKIGFKTTVRPEDMKSYNRSESGDISAQ